MLAAITLTNPMMLGGLALLSLPIIAHLLNRGSQRIYYFPSIRLLQESHATQARVNKLRRLLLLLLRCLLVAAVVGAFVRPVYRDVAAGVAGDVNRDSTVVIVLDVSASMQQSPGGVPLINVARSTVIRTIGSLRVGRDAVNIVLANANPTAMFAAPTLNVRAATTRMNEVMATEQRADWTAALSVAGRQLALGKDARRLVIISDLQKSNFEDLVANRIATPGETTVTVVDLGAGIPENISLGAARTFPARPLQNQPTKFMVAVSNHGPRKKQIPVSLTVNGRSIGSQTVEIDGGQQREVAFSTTLDDVADHAATFRCAADNQSVDDKHYLVSRATARTEVLVLTDDSPNEPGSGVFFLTRALAPQGTNVDHFTVSVANTRQVVELELSDYAVVFIDYIGSLSSELAEQLCGFLTGGGSVVYFCGEGSAVSQLSTLKELTEEIPWIPGRRRELSGGDALFIEGGNWNSPLLREFDLQSQIALEQVRFHRPWGTGQLQPTGRVLLRFSDDSPALVVGAAIAGEIVVANFSAAVESSDIGKYGAYVALVQILARELPGRGLAAASKPLTPGGDSIHDLPGTVSDLGKLTMVGPHGKTIPLDRDDIAVTGEVHLVSPHSAGIYKLMEADAVRLQIPVNVDARESETEQVSVSDVQSLFTQAGFDAQVADAQSAPTVATLKGRPLWGWMLGLAVMACCTELFLLGWWRR